MDTGSGTAPRGDDPTSDRIRAALQGEAAARDWLADWLGPLMLSWARAQVRPGVDWSTTPEDLVQDVWVRVLPELGGLRPHPDNGRMTPALFGVVRRTLINRVVDERRRASRRRSQQGPGGLFGLSTTSSGPVRKAIRSERRQIVERVLEQLGERERLLYVTRLFEGVGLDELCERFGMGRDAVIKSRQRVRQKLSAILSPTLLADLEDE